MGHFATDCPNPKNVKKSTQATRSDIDFEESGSTTSEDTRYDPNNFLAFVASMEFVHDSDSDNEFTNDQKATFLNNLVVEHEKLNKNYLRYDHILEAYKTKIDVLKEKNINILEKKNRFLDLNIILLLRRIRLLLKR